MILFVAAASCSTFAISSCSAKKKMKDKIQAEKKLEKNYDEDFIFNLTCCAVNGSHAASGKEGSQSDTYYIPEKLKILLKRNYFENANIFINAERFNKEYVGLIESSGFYDGADDNADWVDSLLVGVEEELIAEHIVQMEEDLSSENAILEHNEDKVKEIKGKSDDLNFIEFKNEIFEPIKTESGYQIIASTGSLVARKFYDSAFKLTKKETWDIKSFVDAKLLETEYFKYDDNQKLFEKNVESENKYKSIKYNLDGKVIDSTEYDIFEEKKYLTAKKNYEYDDKSRVISEENIIYKYDEKYSMLKYEFNKKYTFSYNKEDIPPDFEYFENGVLKMKNKYSLQKGNYTSLIFFENFSVKVYYESEIRVKEVYFKNGEIVRVKNYGNKKFD